jgi:hypothetical protein
MHSQERFPAVPEVEARCATLVVKHAHVPAVQVLPAAAKLLARHCVPAPELRHLLEHLSTWACSDLVTALFLLTGSEAAWKVLEADGRWMGAGESLRLIVEDMTLKDCVTH